MFHMWDWSTGAGWWMAFGGIWMVLFWGGLIALIVWGIKRISSGSNSSSGRNPLDIVKERYAKGEITREEFEHLKRELY